MHVRRRINGTPQRPRMTVFRSNRGIYIQVIDDSNGTTLASASNREKDHRDLRNSIASAQKLGEAIGKRLKKKKIKTVVFDRNGYLYHGIVKAVADGARKVSITF